MNALIYGITFVVLSVHVRSSLQLFCNYSSASYQFEVIHHMYKLMFVIAHCHYPVGLLIIKGHMLLSRLHTDLHPVAVQPRMHFKCWTFSLIWHVSSCCSAKDACR